LRLLGLVQMASFGLVLVVSVWLTTFLRQELQINPSRAGMLGSIALMLGIVTRSLGRALLRRIGVRPLLRFSVILSAAGCFRLAQTGISVIWIAFALVFIGVGCGFPCAALHPGRAGAAMRFVYMLGVIMILAVPPLIG
jgi:nitrate/nitrite transporter NarK